MVSDCRSNRLTILRIRRTIRRAIRRCHHCRRYLQSRPFHRCRCRRYRRCSHPFHHRCHRCHRCHRLNRPCRHRNLRHQCSDRRSASRCWCPIGSRRCLTSQSVPTHRSCPPSAHPRLPFLRNASRRPVLPGRPRYRATMIRLTSFPMSRRPMSRPATRTCSACRCRDPTHRRSTHDFGSGPPWLYPPTYFDCDLQCATDEPAVLWEPNKRQRMCQDVM